MRIDGGGGVTAVMTDLGFETSVIEAVVKALDASSSYVGETKIEEVPSTSFGDVVEGIELASHTEKARVKVRETLLDMVTGLERYRDALKVLLADADQADVDSAASAQKIEAANDCVDTTSFAAPSQCTPEG